MINETLVQNQLAHAKTLHCEYTVVAEGGGAVCEERPPLKVILPGLRLHFLRYAVFDRKNKDSFAAVHVPDGAEGSRDMDEADASTEKLKTTEDCRVLLARMNPGYVYLLNVDDKDDFHEVEMDEFGNCRPVIWNEANLEANGTPKDFRTSQKEFATYLRMPYTEDGHIRTYWVGYSPEQWSGALLHQVQDADDAWKEAHHFIRVECKPITNQPKPEHIWSYRDINLGFREEDRSQWTVQTRLLFLYNDEKADRRKGYDYVEEDVFVALHDPVGVAQDISGILSEKIIDFKALVEAIQTGEELNDAKERMMCGDAHPNWINREHKDLFALALSTYQLVYNSDQSVQMYDGGKPGTELFGSHYPGRTNDDKHATKAFAHSNYMANGVPADGGTKYTIITSGVDRVKVEMILGIEERKSTIARIQNWRDTFGKFIQDDYFLKSLCFYLDNTDEHRLEGLGRIADQIIVLYTDPRNFDRHLKLAKNVDSNDKWSKWIDNLMSDEPSDHPIELVELLSKEIIIKERLLKGALIINLSNKLARAFRALLQLHSNKDFLKTISIIDPEDGIKYYQDKGTKSFKALFRNADNFRIEGSLKGKLFPIFNYFGTESTPNAGATLVNLADDASLIVIDNEGVSHKFKHVTSVSNSRKNLLQALRKSLFDGTELVQNEFNINARDLKIIDEAEYLKHQIKEIRFSERASNLFNSKGFAQVLTFLQVLNLLRAGKELHTVIHDKNSDDFDVGFKILNTTGVFAQFTDSALSIQRAHYNNVKNVAGVDKLKTGVITRAAAIGGIITTIMSFRDSYKAYMDGDIDAASAYFGAGASFGLSTILQIAGFTGPIGWICLGLGAGFLLLASILKDSDLEYFFKHFLLSEHKKFAPEPNESSTAYALRVLKNREALVDSYNPKIQNTIMNPKDALVRLMDIVVCGNIVCTPTDFGKKETNRYESYHWLQSFKISIQFNQFLADADQVEFKFFLTNDDATKSGYDSEIDITRQ